MLLKSLSRNQHLRSSKIMTNIGRSGRGNQFNSIKNYSILFTVLFTVFFICLVSCSAAKGYQDQWIYDKELKAKVYDYKYLDEMPTYNNEEWGKGLMKDFMRRFSYQFEEGEYPPSHIAFEIVINQQGKPVRARSLLQKETQFSLAVSAFLLSCNGWTPGYINGKAVSTRLLLPIAF